MMTDSMTAITAAVLVFFALDAFAASPFVGNWTEDQSVQEFNRDPVTFVVSGSIVRRTTGLQKPAEFVMDGKPRPLESDPAVVHITAPNEKGGFDRRYEKNGKVVSEASWQVSADQTKLYGSTTYYPPSGPEKQTTTYRRTAGTTGISGTWLPISKESTPWKMQITKESGVLIVRRSNGHTYRVDGQPKRVNDGPSALFQDSVWSLEQGIIQKRGLSDGVVTTRGQLQLSDDGRRLIETDEWTSSSGKPMKVSLTFKRE
jgi:hypothetical protein